MSNFRTLFFYRFLYVYLGNLYLGEVGEEFVNSFSASSKVFSAPDFKYESAMAALNAAINTVKNVKMDKSLQ